MIVTIFKKDFRDAVRNYGILVSLVIPVGLGIFYGFLFDDDDANPKPEVEIAYVAGVESAFLGELETVAEEAVRLDLRQLESPDAVRTQVLDEEVDLGLIIPEGFDEALEAGEQPDLVVITPPEPGVGSNFVIAALDPVLRQLAGQQPPANLQVEIVEPEEDPNESIFEELGPRTYFILTTAVMTIAMITMFAIPSVLTEENEKKTLDALVMIASYVDVVAAKALLSFTYILIALALLLGITGLGPDNPLYFAGVMILLSAALTGLGLFVGGIFQSTSQLNTWSGIFLIPIIAPAFAVGLPVPSFVDTILLALPTSQAMRLAVNSMGSDAQFSDPWLSVLVLIAWTALAFGLLLYSLSRREA